MNYSLFCQYFPFFFALYICSATNSSSFDVMQKCITTSRKPLLTFNFKPEKMQMKNLTCTFSENAETGDEQTFFQELRRQSFESHHVFHIFSSCISYQYFQLSAQLHFSTNIYMQKSQNATLKPYFSFSHTVEIDWFQNRYVSEDSHMECVH